MDTARPELSILVETCNLDIATKAELVQGLDALAAQEVPADRRETLVVVEATNAALAAFLEAERPEVRVVRSEDTTYYGMKLAGVAAARGAVLGFCDSDCVALPDWASSLLRSIAGGADVVAGKTRYEPGKRFSRTFSLFSFGQVQNDASGHTNSFIVNNFGIRRQILIDHPFENRHLRTGPGYSLARTLRALGFRMVYDPGMRVHHFNHGLAYHMANRVRSGHEIVNMCRLDTRGHLDESRYRRLGPLTPLVFAARRVTNDLRLLRHHRRDLDITPLAVPYHVGATLAIRSLEVGSGLVSWLRPGFFGRRYGW